MDDLTRYELNDALSLLKEVEAARDAYVRAPDDAQAALRLQKARLAVEIRYELYFERLVRMASRSVREDTVRKVAEYRDKHHGTDARATWNAFASACLYDLTPAAEAFAKESKDG